MATSTVDLEGHGHVDRLKGMATSTALEVALPTTTGRKRVSSGRDLRLQLSDPSPSGNRHDLALEAFVNEGLISTDLDRLFDGSLTRKSRTSRKSR